MIFIYVYIEYKVKDAFYREGDSFIFVCVEFEVFQFFQLEQFKDLSEVCVYCLDKRIKQGVECVEKIFAFMLRDWVKLFRVICKVEEKNNKYSQKFR